MLDPNEYPNAVAFAFDAAGGIGAAARACGRSYQALSKWRSASRLPRTDYTGETSYAIHLARAAKQNGNPFDAEWLLQASAPTRAAA
jgi:hypothetical protein